MSRRLLGWPVYRGYHLYTLEPNWTGAGDLQVAHLSVELGIAIGRRGVRPRGGSSRLTIPFSWLCTNRSAFESLYQFWMTRRGRQVPVWMPSWVLDLPLAADVGPADTDIIIRACDYTTRMLQREERRHVVFNQPGNAMVVRRVTASLDNGDGTETLTLESATGASWSAQHTMTSFCLLVRAASDELAITFHSLTVMSARLEFIEVPFEIAA